MNRERLKDHDTLGSDEAKKSYQRTTSNTNEDLILSTVADLVLLMAAIN